jgi:hypothetical protein
MHQTISDTDAKISSLSGDLQGLQDKLNRAVTSQIAVVSNETRDNTHRLRKRNDTVSQSVPADFNLVDISKS